MVQIDSELKFSKMLGVWCYTCILDIIDALFQCLSNNSSKFRILEEPDVVL